MACQLPGAQSPEEYWGVLMNGVRTTGEFPHSRRRDTDPFLPKGVEYRKGGYLSHVDQFDAPFFRISRKEAEAMDPNQRLFLETAWEAMEDAGVGKEKLKNTKTAVYIGQETNFNNQYRQLIEEEDELALVGSHTGITASRIQYLLNLRGPSLVLDTACSSGLVALHMACQGLRNNEFQQALVGGLSTFIFPAGKDLVHEAGTGIIRAFDKDANGTVWGEGVGVLLLKPLEQALRDGDPIRAVIKGSAINNDGQSNGITAPNADAQAEVLQMAWKMSGIHPETISYIETHGTGTQLGDPIEIKGIAKAFRAHTDKRQFCGIGSVKTNIGHTVGNSGIASLIKMVLALEHAQLPQTIGFETPNPFINFVDSPVYVNDRLRNWESADHPRRCGVSAFGFSGTNAHVVLEEAPQLPERAPAGTELHLFTLSAKSYPALRESLRRHLRYLQNHEEVSLSDLCYTANTGRGHYQERMIFQVRTVKELRDRLRQVLHVTGEEITRQVQGAGYGKHKIVHRKGERQQGELSEQDVIRMSAEINRRLVHAPNVVTPELAEELCASYLAGAEIDWSVLYKIGHRAMRLPVYPFDRLRHWVQVDGLLLKQREDVGRPKKLTTPLVDRCQAITMEGAVYETDLDATYWVLEEHRIGTKAVLPGTAYLEISLEAAREYGMQEPITVAEMQFLAPFTVEDGETRTLQTVLSKTADGMRVTLCSQGGDDTWMLHATGLLENSEEGVQADVDMEAVFARCPHLAKREENVVAAGDSILFGPHFQCVTNMWIGEEEALIEITMPSSHQEELGDYSLHPALLDRATGSVVDLADQKGKGMHLAFSYRNLRLYRPLPERFYSRVRRLEVSTDDLQVYKVQLFDVSGCVLAEIGEFSTIRVPIGQEQTMFYMTEWRETPLKETTAWTNEAVCILKDDSGLADQLADRLRENGRRVIEVQWGQEYRSLGGDRYLVSGTEDDYARLLRETDDVPWKHLYHLFTWNCKPAEGIEQLKANQERGVLSLLRLSRCLMNSRGKQDIQIVLIADHASAVTGKETVIKPEQASLLGLGKVIGEEALNLRCRTIDLDEATGLDVLWRELSSQEAPYSIAYRGGVRYTPEVRPSHTQLSDSSFALRRDGIYLITGGTGGIGLELAHWLTQQNATVALLHRSPLPERARWAELSSGEDKLSHQIRKILTLEASGAKLLLVQGDVADADSLRSALQKVREHGPLRGVFHGAGVAGDGFLIRKHEVDFRKVLAPKVEGTWWLNRLTQLDDLDFFILFSSVTAILSGAGQGDYTAANAYLDAFAAEQRRKGRPMLSINWSTWKEAGMAFDYGVTADGIFRSLTTEEALQGLAAVLPPERHQVIIGRLNYDLLTNVMDQAPYLLSEEIHREVSRLSASKRNKRTTRSLIRPASVVLSGRSEGDYTEREQQIAAIWAEVLGLDTVNIHDNFYEYGGDSILAIKIANLIEERLQTRVSISDLFQHLTIYELTRAIGDAEREVPAEVAAGTRAEEHVGELSSGQQRLWFLHQIDPGIHVYNLRANFEMRGLDPEAFLSALRILTARHAALRTVIREESGVPKQAVLPSHEPVVEWVEADEVLLHDLLNEEHERTIDFSEPLWRVKVFMTGADRQVIAMTIHHLITDGWSMLLLLDEWQRLYESRLKGTELELPPLRVQYQDWVETQAAWMQSTEFANMERYWLEELTKPLPVLEIATDYPRPQLQTYNGSYHVFEIDAERSARLKELAKRNQATLHMLLLSSYFLLLQKLSQQDEIVVGFPIAGRESKEWESVLGLFMNMICLRVSFADLHTFDDLLRVVQAKSVKAYANSRYPFDLLVSKVNPERDLSRSPIFQTMFQFFENYQANERQSLYELCFLCKETDGKIEVRWEYNIDLYTAKTIERLTEYFLHLVKVITDHEQVILADVRLLGETAEADVRELYTNFDPESVPELTVIQRFEQIAANHMGETAVTYFDQRVTYGELEAWSNRIAHLLREAGVTRNQPVGLLLNRGLPLIAGILGILKAGGAYVPIDPQYPLDRVCYMLQHSEVQVLISEAEQAERFRVLSADLPLLEKVLDLTGSDHTIWTGVSQVWLRSDIEAQDSSGLKLQSSLDDLMYLIYTSGSTGRPKGVMVTQLNAMNFLLGSIAQGRLGRGDQMAWVTSISFDISVFEIFGALLSGAGLHIISQELLTNPEELLTYLHGNGITIWHSVPALFHQLVLYLRSRSDLTEWAGKSSIRRIMIGGEAWSAELAKEILALFPQAELMNMYGPTEATIWATCYQVEQLDWINGILPIGRPLVNNAVMILDEQGMLCPVGVPGEICICGLNVTPGYYKDPVQTAKAYSIDPKTRDRVYRTGDIGRYSSKGVIEYLGRRDGLIKVRGYRIEAGEIESVLLRIGSVSETAVVALSEGDTNKLVCYYVSPDDVTAARLRDHLRESLPEYMIPSHFFALGELPRTANGKIDRQELAGRTLPDRLTDEGELSLPTTGTERLISQIWEELLGWKGVGIHDNFFEIGGNSFLVSQMHYRLSEQYPGRLRIVDLFTHTTIAKIAAYLDSDQAEPGPLVIAPPKIGEAELEQELLDMFDQISSGKLSLDEAVKKYS
ncbi:amino acid adenylation domain-containing protein [Brevibacillus sp. AG162]|uniref:amino acid adenylation domain-containing protein n=1 Tax=Brevibacillus sp. AG162 TaxID=2572910 RepID=UPI00351AC161